MYLKMQYALVCLRTYVRLGLFCSHLTKITYYFGLPVYVGLAQGIATTACLRILLNDVAIEICARQTAFIG